MIKLKSGQKMVFAITALLMTATLLNGILSAEKCTLPHSRLRADLPHCHRNRFSTMTSNMICIDLAEEPSEYDNCFSECTMVIPRTRRECTANILPISFSKELHFKSDITTASFHFIDSDNVPALALNVVRLI